MGCVFHELARILFFAFFLWPSRFYEKFTDEHLCDSDPHACIVLQTIVSEECVIAVVSHPTRDSYQTLYAHVVMVGNV